MPGILAIVNKPSVVPKFKRDAKNVVKFFRNENYFLEHFTNNKFLNDKCTFEDDSYILILDGVILNKLELLEGKIKFWTQRLLGMYKENGDSFFKDLRGSFSGLLFDKKLNKWIVFTDHIGSKSIYYSSILNNIVFASEIKDIYEYNKVNRIDNELDINAAYMLLSFGYMIGNNTLSKNVKRLLPGQFIIFENNEIRIDKYYEIKNKPNYSLTESEAIEKIDQHFKRAIEQQFEKDKEYNCRHLVGLSGGLDSRMTAWIAHEMGYENQLNFTFSQSNYLDEKIPKKISEKLKHEWIFKALDNGIFLKEIDNITKITGGNALYFGLAHGNSLLKYLNLESFGLFHTGQLGDVIIGTYSKTPNYNKNYSITSGAYSKRYVSKINFSKNELEFENEELFILFQRGFLGINMGLLGMQTLSETMSPFYNLEFMEFALSIPIEMRYNHNIYKKWVIKKYPKAADYIWEKTGTKLNTRLIKIYGKKYNFKKLMVKILSKLKITKIGQNTKNHMNPIDYWMRTNFELNKFIEKYYNENINKVTDSNLKEDIVTLFQIGTGKEKLQVISLLSAIKLYFSDSR